MIDGEGVTSLGREGMGLRKFSYIKTNMNEHESIGKLAPSTSRISKNAKIEDQTYKLNKIVYDCVSSSPFYSVKDYFAT
jgi:hypothetical protein